VAFGDSLTAGLGLSAQETYPALLQEQLKQDGYDYEMVNSGVSGDTSAGGVRRIDWALEGDVRFLILELGANDFLRGQPVGETKKNLSEIIDRAQSRKAKVLLAGMLAPTNTGREYERQIRDMFIDLAREKGVTLIPFFLEGVAGVESLNQADGIHPNLTGSKIVAQTVYKYLKPLLDEQK
jgi:acyl-CoA thioesterase I